MKRTNWKADSSKMEKMKMRMMQRGRNRGRSVQADFFEREKKWRFDRNMFCCRETVNILGRYCRE